MFRLLFLLFLIVPAIEIALFIQVGGIIGIMPTLLLIVITAVAGAALLRVQGLTTMVRVQETLRRGEIPAVELIEGVMLLVSGAFLLTPGFFTDMAGFLVLLPAIRRSVATWLLLHTGIIRVAGSSHPPGADTYADSHGPHIIEGEYQKKD